MVRPVFASPFTVAKDRLDPPGKDNDLASHRTASRPLAPHLSVWKWGPHMAVSIFHRATGSGMATVGTLLLVGWLAALAGGPEAYARYLDWFTYSGGSLNIIGWVLAVGLTWALFQHLANGVRHLVMDIGAGFELGLNKRLSTAVFIFAPVATIAYWAWLMVGK